ncbi:MAG: tail protein X [Shimia sp.]
MTLYRTIDGDMVDAICHAHYGNTDAVEAVLEANPGLAGQGAVLQGGLLIVLPEIVASPVAQPIRLWGS